MNQSSKMIAQSRRTRMAMTCAVSLLAVSAAACVPAAGGTTTTTTAKATTTTAKATTTTAKATTTTARATTTTAKATTTTAKATTTTAKATTTTAKPTTTTAKPTTTTAPGSTTFDIQTRISGATSTQTILIQQAVQRWQSVIIGDVPTATTSFPANDCVNGAPAFSGTIDDILVDVVIMPIDGVGGVLGQAGPCYVRTDGSLPLYGTIQLDTADAADLESTNYFGAVVLHEMGHILGFGTLWSYNRSLLNTSNAADPRFVGAQATAAWQAIGGTGNVPVEASGGVGTALSHWSEATLNNELMTGYLSQTNPLSKITIGSMADLGYVTDPSAADSFGLPGISARQMAAAASVELAPTNPRPAPQG